MTIHLTRTSLLLAATLPLLSADPAGVHRTRVGDMDVMAILDGSFTLNAALLKGMTLEEARPLLGGKDGAETPCHAFLVTVGGKRILVDTGTGHDPKGVTGQLLSNLATIGVDPASIDVVLITHFHFDHVGGLVKADGTRAFPKAVVRVSQAEHDFWLSEPSRLPDILKPSLPVVKKALAPYQAAGTYKPFAAGEAPVAGVGSFSAPGHTEGHTVYTFTSKGQTLWCIGDLIHYGAIQFAHPAVAVAFDADSTQAIASRKDGFKRAANGKVTVAATHLAFPGMGSLAIKDEAFTFQPVKR